MAKEKESVGVEGKRYNLYIVHKHRIGKKLADSCVGKNLSERQAERRTLAVLHQIDRDHYFVDEVEVGEDSYKVILQD